MEPSARFLGTAREFTVSTYVVPSGGAVEKVSTYREIADFPYYYPGAKPDNFGGYYFKTLHWRSRRPHGWARAI